jgi:hypothetical protein
MRRYCLIAVALLLCAAGLAVLSLGQGKRHEPEPVFCGRSVTEWLANADFETNRPAVTLAMVALGEKAVPTLRHMLHSGNKLQRGWFTLAPRWLYLRLPFGADQFDRKDRAMWALQTLGRVGHAAIPDLITILRDPTEHWNQRSKAISTLRDVQAEPALLIPVLNKLTNDTVMKGAAGMELQLLQREIEMGRQREAERALRASLPPRQELPRPEFHPPASLLSGLSLSAPESRAGERDHGPAEPWPSVPSFTHLLEPTRPAPLLFTFTTSAQDVIQDSVHKFQMGTNQFSVKFQYTATGSNNARAFDEAHQNQEVRYKVGEFTMPPILLRSTNTSGRDGFHGLSEKEAGAIVKALKGK